MNSRYVGALIIAPYILFLFLGGIYLKYSVMVLAVMGMYEFYRAASKKGSNPISKIGYFMCIIYYIYIGNPVNYKIVFLMIIISLFALMCISVLDLKYNFMDISITVMGFLYPAVFFSSIVYVNNLNFGNYFVWLIFISSWICDTSAYYSGKVFGKKKLCPRLSPNKTVEGSIGGIAGSTIACTLFGAFSIYMGVPVLIYHYIGIGILCGVFSQFGDLFASSIKRYAGIKDYSKLIPGHGGILDRFDSVLFSGIIVYYYMIFLKL